MEYYKITDKKLISEITWWVNDSEFYNTPLDFFEDLISMCKKREFLADSITRARLSAKINEIETDTEELSGNDWFENLEITPMPEEPDEILIPKSLMEEYLEYFDNLSFEEKFNLLMNDTAEVLSPFLDFNEKEGNVLRKLIQIKNNPKKEDILELIRYIDE